ncbi:cell division protein ZapA [Polynucleobacter meluiroseus]|jgi:cell division protein ZapA|uniref:Cell division protein ZapA n=1 Tax=Polynucleobacter meluiroseus TaxID=1938814 RepID=A0A240E1D7_9BURK|nr:cell division protein ZapA [Polynucleobacter meluiroseus]
MSQQRIEVTLAGQKITLATSTEHEPLLRSACALVDEQIQLAITGGNRSIERASMMAAIKIAGDLITLKSSAPSPSPSSPSSIDDADALSELHAEVRSLEDHVDSLMQTFSLPGSPRPIVP